MAKARTVDIFRAACPVCEDEVHHVRQMACPSCDVRVLDMNDAAVAGRARDLGVRSVPAVPVEARLASCCAGRGVDEAALREAGVGEPLD